MSQKPIAILAPNGELTVDMDQETGQFVIGLETPMQAAAATIPADQLQPFITKVIGLAGHTLASQPQTTHKNSVSLTTVRADQLGFVEGHRPGTMVIAFPIGGLTLAFEIQKDMLSQGLERFLSEGVEGPEPPKPN